MHVRGDASPSGEGNESASEILENMIHWEEA